MNLSARSKRGIPFNKRFLVTGDTGFLAHHLIPVLEKRHPNADVVAPGGTKFFDLTRQTAAEQLLELVENRAGYIHTVYNLAALSGGIEDNRTRPASYYYQNLMICTNLTEVAAARKVRKLVQFMGGCSYPNKEGEDLFTEDMMWEGRPVGTSAGYSMAKKMSIIAAESYKQQFGLDTTILIPTNLIGEWDNFHPSQSHVVPGLISRFVEARTEGYDTVTVWGSGKPVRDFIYAGDAAELSVRLAENYPEVGPVNISTGKGTSIAEIAEMVLKATGYKGNIHFDRTKPDGQIHKVLSNEKMFDILREDYSFMPTEEAIERTVEWYERRVVQTKK